MVNFFKELEKQEKQIIKNYNLIKKASDNFNNSLKTNYNSMDSEYKKILSEIKSDFKSLNSKLKTWNIKYSKYLEKVETNSKCKEDLEQILNSVNKGIKTNETENFLNDYFINKKLLKKDKKLQEGVTNLDLFSINNVKELEKQVSITFKNKDKISDGIKEIRVNNKKSLDFLDKIAVCNVLYRKLNKINNLASNEKQITCIDYYEDIKQLLIKAKNEYSKNKKLALNYSAYEMCRAEDNWEDSNEEEKIKQKKEDYLESLICDLSFKEKNKLFYNSDLSKLEDLEVNEKASEKYKDDKGNDFIGKINCNTEELGLKKITLNYENIQGLRIPLFIDYISSDNNDYVSNIRKILEKTAKPQEPESEPTPEDIKEAIENERNGGE